MKRKGKTPIKRKIRLYRKTDRDLMMLYKAPKFSFQKAISVCLKNVTYGEMTYIKVPELEELNYPDDVNNPNRVRDGCPDKMEIVFDVKDEKANEWLDSIPMGRRNDFMKHLIRGFLTGPILFPYVSNDDPRMEKINEGKQNVTECIRTEEEYRSDIKDGMARLKKAMGKSGKTIDDLLNMIEESEVNDSKELFKEEHPQEKEPPKASVETDDSFDLMGALANM